VLRFLARFGTFLDFSDVEEEDHDQHPGEARDGGQLRFNPLEITLEELALGDVFGESEAVGLGVMGLA